MKYNLKPKNKISLDDVVKRADNLKMSYGKYVGSKQFQTDIVNGYFKRGEKK